MLLTTEPSFPPALSVLVLNKVVVLELRLEPMSRQLKQAGHALKKPFNGTKKGFFFHYWSY